METTRRTCGNERASDAHWDGMGPKSRFPRLLQADGEIVHDPKLRMQV
jgi:hypothetical protein